MRLLQRVILTPDVLVYRLDVLDARERQRTLAVEFVIDRALWEAEAVQSHPLVNTATMVVAHADLERFLAATRHVPRVIDVPVAKDRSAPSERAL